MKSFFFKFYQIGNSEKFVAFELKKNSFISFNTKIQAELLTAFKFIGTQQRWSTIFLFCNRSTLQIFLAYLLKHPLNLRLFSKWQFEKSWENRHQKN
jgi:hypothetical protein